MPLYTHSFLFFLKSLRACFFSWISALYNLFITYNEIFLTMIFLFANSNLFMIRWFILHWSINVLYSGIITFTFYQTVILFPFISHLVLVLSVNYKSPLTHDLLTLSARSHWMEKQYTSITNRQSWVARWELPWQPLMSLANQILWWAAPRNVWRRELVGHLVTGFSMGILCVCGLFPWKSTSWMKPQDLGYLSRFKWRYFSNSLFFYLNFVFNSWSLYLVFISCWSLLL